MNELALVCDHFDAGRWRGPERTGRWRGRSVLGEGSTRGGGGTLPAASPVLCDQSYMPSATQVG